MKDILKIVAINIKKERLKQGLTQENLAFKAGLHTNYIGLIERRKRSVTVVSLQKIAEALNVEIIKLLKD